MYSERYIGDRIRQRRNEIGLTQKELAAKINPGTSIETAPHTQVAQWENGKKKPGTDALIRLCNALDCDMDYILGAIDVPRRAVYDVKEQTGLSDSAVNSLMEAKQRNYNAGLDILSALLSDRKFWEAIANLNYAKFAGTNMDRPMSDGLEAAVLQVQMMNGIERHPGATILEPKQMRDMNLYQASQKFSECAARIANDDKKKTAPVRKQ